MQFLRHGFPLANKRDSDVLSVDRCATDCITSQQLFSGLSGFILIISVIYRSRLIILSTQRDIYCNLIWTLNAHVQCTCALRVHIKLQ